MPFTTLTSPELLHDRLSDPEWVVVDCRFDLSDPERGRRDYLSAHIPGAVYAHLDDDLSGPVVPGRTGRHPLPTPADFSTTLSSWGVGPGVQVVAYDDRGGAIAARLWWMLHWLGHSAAAVLDGGWQAWQALEAPTSSGTETRASRLFTQAPLASRLAEAEEVSAALNDPAARVIDARDAARFRGEHEPIDPVAGHIPGALSAPFAGNLGPDGRFLSVEALRARFEALLSGAQAENVICYCGSGVTAAHNLLALAHAGLGGARLYAGSWSHWITDPGRPIAQGASGA